MQSTINYLNQVGADTRSASASFTVSAQDYGRTITIPTGTVTVTLPSGLPIGFWCNIASTGGTVTISAASGVTFNGTSSVSSGSIVMVESVAANTFVASGGAGGASGVPTTDILRAYQTADAAYTTQAPANTNLSVTVAGGTKYAIQIDGGFSNGPGFFQIDFNGGTATATAFRVYATGFSAISAATSSPDTSTPITSLATTKAFGTVQEEKFLMVRGYIDVNVGGTFILRASQFSTNASASTLYKGASMILTKLA